MDTLKHYIERIINYLLNDNYIPKKNNTKYKYYINSISATKIALIDTNLISNIIKELSLLGYNPSNIKIKDFYITLVKYNERYAWYIKINEASFIYNDNKTGYIDESSNISCLIYADNKEYSYIDYSIKKNNIKLVNDNELYIFLKNVNH